METQPTPTSTNGLILDLRDRMARIETKLDAHNDAHVVVDRRLDATEKRMDEMDTKIDANTAEIAAARTRMATLAGVASAVVAILTLLGDNLWDAIKL